MHRTLLALALAAAVSNVVAAPWTYRGTLEDGGQPAQGRYDLRLTLRDASGAAAVVPAVTLPGVDIVGGRFAVEVDFGADLSRSGPLMLHAEVRQGSEPFVPLGAPRAFDPKAALGSGGWDLTGNAGTDPAVNFLGTVDAQPLVLRTGNAQSLVLQPSSVLFNGRPITNNVIAGSYANTVAPGVRGATVGGGGVPPGDSDPVFEFEDANRVTGHYATVAGGYNNVAGGSGGNPVVGAFSTVGGGGRNAARGSSSTVAGGQANTATGDEGTIGGGSLNQASGTQSVVGGGTGNVASGRQATVGGGAQNTAAGVVSTVGGGNGNLAFGLASVVLGGDQNVAYGAGAVVPGGFRNCAGGDRSWAGGTQAKVRVPNGVTSCGNVASSGDADGDEGTFIWSDAQGSNVVSTGPNQFIVRASGGFWFGATGTPTLPPGRLINTSTGAFLTSGGTWTNASSRALKTAFAAVDVSAVLDRVLELPISRWRYTAATDEGSHLGPMAEDFHRAFGLGADDGASISTVDANGVALAAIQGLDQRLRAENARLTERLRMLETHAAQCGAH